MTEEPLGIEAELKEHEYEEVPPDEAPPPVLPPPNTKPVKYDPTLEVRLLRYPPEEETVIEELVDV